jgi:hypothetical protein
LLNFVFFFRKKQFPPVFWQRLYNVNGGDVTSRRFVGEVEVGGWPVPQAGAADKLLIFNSAICAE